MLWFGLHPEKATTLNNEATRKKRVLGLRDTLMLFTLCAVSAIIALGAISWWGHEQGTATATQTFVAKDVTADILPPPMYLIEMRLVISQAAEGLMPMDRAKAELTRLRAEYEHRAEYWRTHPPYGLEAKLLGAEHEAGLKFMDLAADALRIIERDSDPAVVQAALRTANAAYLVHRAGVDDTVREANSFVAKSLDDYERTAHLVKVIQIGVLIGLLITLVLLGWWISRSVWAAVGGEPEDAAAVARAVVRGDLSVDVPVQPGDRHSIMASMNEMFVHAALHDGLTGAYNRAGFERAVKTIFAGQPHTLPASIIVIDLDHFKPVNDTAGHAAGDTMLIKVAQAIGSLARTSDVVARLGGDEFGVLLPTCDVQHALAVAEKIRVAITHLSFPFNGKHLQLGATLGVAELTTTHATAADWIAEADKCCLDAKRGGRGTVHATARVET